jgi:hypothetical protein
MSVLLLVLVVAVLVCAVHGPRDHDDDRACVGIVVVTAAPDGPSPDGAALDVLSTSPMELASIDVLDPPPRA